MRLTGQNSRQDASGAFIIQHSEDTLLLMELRERMIRIEQKLDMLTEGKAADNGGRMENQ